MVFTSAQDVDPVIAHILQSAATFAFAVIAYCFMPDHLHLLVEGRSDEADLRLFMRDWKQRTAYTYARLEKGRLWQVGFYDHVLRSDESTRRHAEYIVGNPVRAALTKSVGEYPFARILLEDPEA